MKKIYCVILVLLVSAISIQGINIYLANTLDSKSIYVQQLQKQVSMTEQENLILKSKVLEYTSFESVASRAAALGFAPEKEFVTLSSRPAVAFNK